MTAIDLSVDLAIALGLGLLVGLQRERQKDTAAGLRTFGLVSLSGALAATLGGAAGPWLIAAGLLCVAALGAVSHYESNLRGAASGLTTEVALVVMFLTGAFVVAGDRRLAIVLGGGIALLLHAKEMFRKVMERLGERDLRAIMQFVLIALVILPMLPNENYGPWRVLNPFEIWLLVVLIVGINLGGYIAYKFIGARVGTLAAGLLGGVISSTATTVSYARRSRGHDEACALASAVVTIATAVVLLRVLIEVAVVSGGMVWEIFAPISIVLVAAVLVSLLTWRRVAASDATMPEQESPTMLRAALTFGALYAAVLLAVAWVNENMGDRGLYTVAAVAGLTDVDAITLSIAGMTRLGEIEPRHAWRLILIAFVSNLLFKVGIVAVAGSRRLLFSIGRVFAVLGIVTALVVLLYPW